MAVDQQLLNRSGGQGSAKNGEEAMASRLMQEKNKSRSAESTNSTEEERANFDQYSPLAQMGSIIRRQGVKQGAGTGQKDSAAAASVIAKINEALAGFLKTCWTNIIFFSFGTSIIWIDIHVLGSIVFPKMFCKLGHEWIPAEMKKASPKQAESAGDMMGGVENGCCCCVNGCCGIIVIAAIAIMATVLGFYNSTIGEFFGWISGIFTP
ncbi:MAG: hypothetical protein WC564_01325 [Patescibacteria group bacterium]